MSKHHSCGSRDELVGIEDGLVWPQKAKDSIVVTEWRRGENVTKCMKLLIACLAAVLLVLVFYHFRLSFMEYSSTKNTVESLEGMVTDKISTVNVYELSFSTDRVTLDTTPETPKLATTVTEVSDEDNDSSKKFPTTSSPFVTKSPFRYEDYITPEMSNGIADEKFQVPDSEETNNPTPTMESYDNINRIRDILSGGISINSTVYENGARSEGYSTTKDQGKTIEDEINRQETQPLKTPVIIDDIAEDYDEYIYSENYDDYIPATNNYEYTEDKELDFVPPDILSYPNMFSFSALTDSEKGFADKLLATNDSSLDKVVDKYLRASQTGGFAKAFDFEQLRGSLLPEEVSDYSDYGDEEDSETEHLLATQVPLNLPANQKSLPKNNSQFLSTYDLLDFNSLISALIHKVDEEPTNNGTSTQEITETQSPPIKNPTSNIDLHMPDYLNSEKDLSQEPSSPDSSIIELDSTTSTYGELDKMFDESIDLLDYDISYWNCILFNNLESLEEGSFFFDDVFDPKRCSSLKRKVLDEASEESQRLKRSITDESIRERLGDSQSASKAAQILTTIQRVIKQDKRFLEDKESNISGPMKPVVKSEVENFYKKMEAVSAHIDKLQERYFMENQLDDDYVSQEFPPQI